jgi:hypothetical protein
MCDYSLEHIQHRPAQENEKLVTQRFETGSHGFAAPGNCSVAVCVQPDTRLILHDIPETMQTLYRLDGTEEVTFARIEDEPYHDGVRFRDGTTLSLQRLPLGLTASVLPMAQQAAGTVSLFATA